MERATEGLPLKQDEGMWTFDNPPLTLLRRHYGFLPDPPWLDRVRLASVRFNDGGSGSFVSSRGLVLTNHHVALGQLQKMSRAGKDFVKDGFLARGPAREKRCPDLEINQLVSFEEVTARVNAAIDPKAPESAQNEQRKAETSRIEKESAEATGLRSDVVELYQGGEYWLYRFKKYTDVRLVMAPELEAAFFGGDPDNFTYPRYALDFAFFRVYEAGKPVRPAHFFPFSAKGAGEGELCFVTGHPGSTDRLLTLSQLRLQRDTLMPARLGFLRERRQGLARYAAGGAERARRAQDLVFRVENSIKAMEGEYEGLLEPRTLEAKEEEERILRRRAHSDPALQAFSGSWDRVEKAQAELGRRYRELFFRKLHGHALMGIADTVVRYVSEVRKPNEKRFEEYRDSGLESLHLRLYSPAPVYPDLEAAMLAQGLSLSLKALGPEDPFIRAVLQGKSPEETAKEALAHTRLKNVGFRKRLIREGAALIESCGDSMIVLARRADPFYREMRKWYEDEVQSVERAEGTRIARVRFACHGKNLYPDATFTLRMSYGQPASYDAGKTRVPHKTTFGGLYSRADGFDNTPPFRLPKRVLAAKAKVRLGTPLNFVTTHDIIGGNSGSPVIDRKARLVGLIFDGNIQSLAGRYAYSRESSRAVSVHSAGILEALRAIYGAKALLRELAGQRASSRGRRRAGGA